MSLNLFFKVVKFESKSFILHILLALHTGNAVYILYYFCKTQETMNNKNIDNLFELGGTKQILFIHSIIFLFIYFLTF